MSLPLYQASQAAEEQCVMRLHLLFSSNRRRGRTAFQWRSLSLFPKELEQQSRALKQ